MADIAAERKSETFWYWPWFVGAALLRFRLDTLRIDDAPTPWSARQYVFDLLERYSDALLYLVFFLATAAVHRNRYRTKRPTTGGLSVSCVVMFMILKTHELEISLFQLGRWLHIPINILHYLFLF